MTDSVLIVDDDADAREALRLRLTHAGFAVAALPDARAALRSYESSRPSVVLLDASMPGVSGFELCGQIKERGGENVAVVFVSGASSPTLEYVEKCARISGGDAFVRKPFDGREIVELVRRLTREPAAAR